MKAMSSTCRASPGSWSQTHAPLSPCRENPNGDFISGPGLPKKTSIGRFGRRPSLRVSSGFGSNVSMALGPPSMNSQMTERAFAG